ncbi:MAG: amidase [Gammaproteobacteria bacterium]|nr:amidase [Gammaproteobacteria bacterium]MDH5653598.1 amidase [Gammaproteobacteria bacterium]
MSKDISDLFSNLDGVGLGEMVNKGEVSALELVDESIRRIEALNPQLNAVVHKNYDAARAIAQGPLPDGPFKGVPYLLKELASMWEGQPTTNSCLYLKDFIAPVDLEIVSRIKKAGFILVGKSNAPEFGWALTTEPAMYGPTHNPWKQGITAGGSSGGSSVAVATGMVPIAEASDGGGSIRVPASNNGIVGMKPSRGTATFAPIWADYWHGAAQFLCVSRTVRDTAAYLDAIYGTLPGDSFAAPPREPGFFLDQTKKGAGKLKIGFTVTAPDGQTLHPECIKAVENTVQLLADLGHEVEEHNMNFEAEAIWEAYTRMTAAVTVDNFNVLKQFVGHDVREDEVAPVLWSMLTYGRSLSAPQHANDIEAVKMASRNIASDLHKYDVYITPTMPQLPRPLGYYDMTMTDLLAYNRLIMSNGIFMYPFNISGQPGISLPLHWTPDGIPVGIQAVGRNNDEATLLRLAAQLEQAQPWKDKRPPITA